MCGQERWQPPWVAARHPTFSRDAVNPRMAAGCGEPCPIAGRVIVMDRAEIELDASKNGVFYAA